MAEYIKRELLLNQFETGLYDGEILSPEDTVELIRNIPTADVRPEVHGYWDCKVIETEEIWADWFECSVCGYCLDDSDYEIEFKYCPCCGAKMDRLLNKLP